MVSSTGSGRKVHATAGQGGAEPRFHPRDNLGLRQRPRFAVELNTDVAAEVAMMLKREVVAEHVGEDRQAQLGGAVAVEAPGEFAGMVVQVETGRERLAVHCDDRMAGVGEFARVSLHWLSPHSGSFVAGVGSAGGNSCALMQRKP